MRLSLLFLLSAAVALVVTVLVPCAQAQPSDAAAEAEKHFRIGLELVRDEAWDSALAEFSRSREILPTASAIENAAVCLRELGRFGEALDAYDELRSRFGASLGATERHAVDEDAARIERFVGHIVVTSDPPGAAVIVDGRERGTTPLAAALRVTVGTRVVRISKEGYAPFEERSRVASGETAHIDAHLSVVSRLGSVRVSERSGQRCEVRIDGIVVGATPWEGTLSAGGHTARLQCDGDVGADDTAFDLATGEKKEVSLSAAEMTGELRVEPTPADASVAVDGREVGRGSWGGRLPSGSHKVVVSADWHEPQTLSAGVSSRSPQVLRPTLREIARMFFEIEGGRALAMNLGVSGVANCASGCDAIAFQMKGGYSITPRVALDFGGGIVSAEQLGQQHLDVTTSSGAFGTDAYGEKANATLFLAGFGLRRRFFDRTPLVLRVFGGVGREFADANTQGDFTSASGLASVLGHRAVSVGIWTPVGGPEVRFGYRFDAGFALDVGVSALFFYVPATRAETTPALQDASAPLPPGPSFAGGLGWVVPLTAGLHFEL